MDLLECSLCNNNYDEGKRRARTLPCVHYFCQYCLDQIIKSATPHCPTCRRHIAAQSAETLPPNFLMDDLISKMKAGKVSVDVEENDEDFSAGSCPNHKKCQLYFTCKTHNVKICRDCTVIEHLASQCKIISFKDEMEEIKKMTISNLKTQKLNKEKDISDLQDIITYTESKTQEKKKEIAKLQREVSENEQIMKNTNEALQNSMANKTKIDQIHVELINSKSINQIKQSCKNAEHIIEVAKSIRMSLKKNFKFTPSKSFQYLIDQNSDEFANKILYGGVIVHTTTEVNGEKRFSQLIVKNGDIHFPALASCVRPPAPENTVTVPSLLSRYPTTNADIYLTLAAEGKELGTVYVKLRDTDYAKYMRKLCIGIMGPSYRGAIFEVYLGNFLHTQIEKHHDPSNCLESHPPLPACNEVMQRTTVCIAHDTGLGFVTCAHSFKCRAVGNVISNMSVLEDALKYPQGEVSIKDVGIVLK